MNGSFECWAEMLPVLFVLYCGLSFREECYLPIYIILFIRLKNLKISGLFEVLKWTSGCFLMGTFPKRLQNIGSVQFSFCNGPACLCSARLSSI